jgi:1,4-alpha-glucan branching enzyme
VKENEKSPPPSGIARSTASVVRGEIELLCRGEHPEPFRILGPHSTADKPGTLTVRVFEPQAQEVAVLWENSQTPLPATKIHAEGLFEALVGLPVGASERKIPSADSYRLRLTFPDGRRVETYDPYAFPPLLTDYDLHLMGEGTHYLKYEKLGAHVREIKGICGVHFAVWAPNARRVSVVGDFNRWDGRVHPMRSRGSTGVWELFIPGLGEGLVYKFEVLSQLGGAAMLKADPYAFCAELRPNTASIVRQIDGYEWADANWMEQHEKPDWLTKPLSIYEVHPGSWRRSLGRMPADDRDWLTYRELADQLIPYAKEMGFTHIELMPVMEHPYDASWGYQTTSYFAVTSRYGSPADFMHFVDRCHLEGIGVLLDWTPAHFPRDAHGLALFDGTHLYEHADPRRGTHPDWGTLVFNYGRNEVQNFLISNALFWMDKYHVDGLRVDAVASMLYLDYSRKEGEWLPNQHGGHENLEAIAFLRRLNEVLHAQHPGTLVIAEESTSWPGVTRPTYTGGLGFDLKWNMGWMNDTLRYMARDPIHRRFHHNEMTFSMMYAFSENFVLPLSHDEVVHGKHSLLSKMPGDAWRQFANLRLLFAWQFANPGKKLLFMGSELAPRHEWSEESSLEWRLLESPPHAGMQKLVADLNHLYTAERALHEVEFEWQGFQWLDANDSVNSIFSFLRRARETNNFLVVVANFTPVVHEEYRISVPEAGRYVEILNTDSEYYGGSGVGNLGAVETESVAVNGQPHSLRLRVPPLGAVFLKLDHPALPIAELTDALPIAPA